MTDEDIQSLLRAARREAATAEDRLRFINAAWRAGDRGAGRATNPYPTRIPVLICPHHNKRSQRPSPPRNDVYQMPQPFVDDFSWLYGEGGVLVAPALTFCNRRRQALPSFPGIEGGYPAKSVRCLLAWCRGQGHYHPIAYVPLAEPWTWLTHDDTWTRTHIPRPKYVRAMREGIDSIITGKPLKSVEKAKWRAEQRARNARAQPLPKFPRYHSCKSSDIDWLDKANDVVACKVCGRKFRGKDQMPLEDPRVLNS